MGRYVYYLPLLKALEVRLVHSSSHLRHPFCNGALLLNTEHVTETTQLIPQKVVRLSRNTCVSEWISARPWMEAAAAAAAAAPLEPMQLPHSAWGDEPSQEVAAAMKAAEERKAAVEAAAAAAAAAAAEAAYAHEAGPYTSPLSSLT